MQFTLHDSHIWVELSHREEALQHSESGPIEMDSAAAALAVDKPNIGN